MLVGQCREGARVTAAEMQDFLGNNDATWRLLNNGVVLDKPPHLACGEVLQPGLRETA